MFRNVLYLSRQYVPKGGPKTMNCSLFNNHIKCHFYPSTLRNSFFSPKKNFFCHEIKSKEEELSTKHLEAKAEYDKGIVLSKEGKYKEAVEKFRSSIEKNPDNPAAYRKLGRVLDISLKEHRKAIDVLEEAIKLFPENHRLHYDLGAHYLEHKNYQKAIAQLKRIIELNPNVYLPYITLGETLYHIGRKEEALNTFQKASEIIPKNPFTYLPWGVMLAREKRRKEAMIVLLKGLAYIILQLLRLTKKTPRL